MLARPLPVLRVVDTTDIDSRLALQHQLDFEMQHRQQNQSVWPFLSNLSCAVTTERLLLAFMPADDEDSEDRQ